MIGFIWRVRVGALGLGALLATLTLPQIAHAAVYYISPSGSSTNSGTSSSSPWSLDKAMSSLVAGDVCRVLPGSYTGNVAPVNHGTASARITMVGDLKNPSAATFSGGIECDRTYWTFKGLKFVGSLSLKSTSVTNTARYDSVAWCEARAAFFVGSKNNMIARNKIANTVIPSGATIAFVYTNWLDWPGTGFNSHAERDTLRGNLIDMGQISWKGFLMRVFAQQNVIDSNQIVGRFSGTNGDIQGRYLYNSYYNTFRDNRWTFEADNALAGSPWNCFSLRDSSSYNLFERDTMLCGLQSGFPMYGRMQNAGNASWVGQTVRNTWKDCVFRMTSYAWVQMNANGMVLRNTEFSSSSGPALVVNDDMRYLTVDHCTFYTASGRAAEFGIVNTSSPPESIRIVNNVFYSKSATTTDGVVKFPGTTGFTSHHNDFYTPSGADRAINWSGRVATVSTWCSSSSKDCNSSPGDPKFVSTASMSGIDLRLQSGSAAIGIAEGGGDAGRYPFGSGGPGVDVTAPAAISTLSMGLVSDQVATLLWTAPGDDGTSGTATAYDLRYSTSPITSSNFGSASVIQLPPIPVPGGTAQTFVVLGLAPGTTYYFALKARDEANNWSALSNVVSTTTQTTDQTPPAAVKDLVATP
jgi:hypothetical protein